MTSKQKIINEIGQLISLGRTLIQFLDDYSDHPDLQFSYSYQSWYSKALKVVEFLAPDRYPEFKSYYDINSKRPFLSFDNYVIQDYLKGIDKTIFINFDPDERTLQNMKNQEAILESILPRIDSILSDIESNLLIELQDIELDTAKALWKINVRAAGVIAGVVLESYLHRIVDNHQIHITKSNPTLSDFNDLLKSNNIYDTNAFKKIIYLGGIRNYCAHKKEREPTKEEVEQLIEGTNWVIKNVF